LPSHSKIRFPQLLTSSALKLISPLFDEVGNDLADHLKRDVLGADVVEVEPLLAAQHRDEEAAASHALSESLADAEQLGGLADPAVTGEQPPDVLIATTHERVDERVLHVLDADLTLPVDVQPRLIGSERAQRVELAVQGICGIGHEIDPTVRVSV